MNNRRGVSLAELLLAMSACTVILTTSVGVIHRMMLTQSKSRSFFEVERSAWRLSSQFRRDVHAAHRVVSPGDDAPTATLELRLLSGETIVYGHELESVVRTRMQGEQVVQRERFTFVPEINVHLSHDEASGAATLSVLADPLSAASSSVASTSALAPDKRSVMQAFTTRVSFRAVAVIGRMAAVTPMSGSPESSE